MLGLNLIWNNSDFVHGDTTYNISVNCWTVVKILNTEYWIHTQVKVASKWECTLYGRKCAEDKPVVLKCVCNIGLV
jgi:hypothetical protein